MKKPTAKNLLVITNTKINIRSKFPIILPLWNSSLSNSFSFYLFLSPLFSLGGSTFALAFFGSKLFMREKFYIVIEGEISRTTQIYYDGAGKNLEAKESICPGEMLGWSSLIKPHLYTLG